MKPMSKTSPEPELMLIWSRSRNRTRRRRWYRLPQSIAELMVVVAISGVGMAVVTEGSRRLNKGVTTRAPFVLPIQRSVLPIPLPQPRDPFVIPARPGIDDAMIKQAPEGIDDGMIFPRPGLFRAPAAPPPSPVTPSNPQPLQPRPLP